MNKSLLRSCSLLAGVCVVLTAVWVTTIRAQKSASDGAWQQSTSPSIRMGVKGKEGQVEAYDALFTVSTLDYPNGRIWHEIKKRVAAGQFSYLYFPEDLHVKALPGKYEWTCTVGNEVVARGQFEYTGESGQNNQVKVLK